MSPPDQVIGRNMAKQISKRGTRDFRAEYKRRIERGLKRGLSRSQARGHAKAGEAPVRKRGKTVKQDDALEAALKALRKTNNQSRAAQSAGVSVERFRRFLKSENLASYRGRKWAVTDNRPRHVSIISQGRELTIEVPDFAASSRAGSYRNAVGEFLETNNADHLAPFIGEALTDTRGKRHPFETDPNTLYRLAASGLDGFEQVYRIVT